MHPRHFLHGIGLVILVAHSAYSQTVQLPSWRSFSIHTSVLAPDRGSAHLGGVSRSYYGRTARGPWRQRAAGGGVSGGSASAHVTVIDHEVMDRAMLEEARRRRAARGDLAPAGATNGSRRPQPSGEQAGGLLSVAEHRQQHAAREQQRQDEARRLAALGHQAAEDGHQGAARIYLQMALRRADGELRQQITARLAQLDQE